MRKTQGSLTVEASFLLLFAISFCLGFVLWICFLRDTVYLRLYTQHRANAVLSYVSGDNRKGRVDWERWMEKNLYWRVLLGGDLEEMEPMVEKEITKEASKGLIFPQQLETDVVIASEYVFVICSCAYQFPAISRLAPWVTGGVLRIESVAKATEQEEFLRLIQGIFHAVQEGEDDNSISTGNGS